jgi:hypothetical protein
VTCFKSASLTRLVVVNESDGKDRSVKAMLT